MRIEELPTEVKMLLEIRRDTSGYIAQDEDGYWYHHSTKPMLRYIHNNQAWVGRGAGYCCSYLAKTLDSKDFADSLVSLNRYS